MRLSILLLLLCSLTIPSFAQSVNDYEAPTKAHQLIPGTNVYVIPPTGFSVSENFTGFQNPEDPTSMVMVMSIPGPFAAVSGGFNEEMMAARGMRLQEKQTITVNRMAGLYLEMDQDAQGMTFTKSILVYGNEQETTMINGVSLKDSVSLAEAIRESIRSTVIDEATETDPRAELKFTIDETAGNLQFISVMGNAILCNRDGLTPTESKDGLNFMVDRSFNDAPIPDQKGFCLRRLNTLPGEYKLMSDEYPSPVQLDELDGYELFAVDKADKKKITHLTILFEEDGGYFILMATYKKGAKQAIADVRAIMDTFRRK